MGIETGLGTPQLGDQDAGDQESCDHACTPAHPPAERRAAAAPQPMTTTFDLESLAAVRGRVQSYARTTGLLDDAVDEFVLAVNEIVANAVAHGGGHGSLQLWSDDDQLHCRVSDRGPGMPTDRLTCQPPPLSASRGRGLWLAHQFCHLDIDTGGSGTTVELSTPLADAYRWRTDEPWGTSDAWGADGHSSSPGSTLPPSCSADTTYWADEMPDHAHGYEKIFRHNGRETGSTPPEIDD